MIYKEDSLSLILVISTEIPALHTSKGLLLLYPIINDPICMRPHQLQLHFHFMQPRLLCNSQPEFAPAKDQFHRLLPLPIFLVKLSTPQVLGARPQCDFLFFNSDHIGTWPRIPSCHVPVLNYVNRFSCNNAKYKLRQRKIFSEHSFFLGCCRTYFTSKFYFSVHGFCFHTYVLCLLRMSVFF